MDDPALCRKKLQGTIQVSKFFPLFETNFVQSTGPAVYMGLPYIYIAITFITCLVKH